MSKHQLRDRTAVKSKGQTARKRMYIHMLVLVVVFAALATGAFFLLHGRTNAGTGTKAAFDSLKGPWLRPDGGYVLTWFLSE
jgi:uncharacterized membrane protein YhaH (DUF805 family)